MDLIDKKTFCIRILFIDLKHIFLFVSNTCTEINILKDHSIGGWGTHCLTTI